MPRPGAAEAVARGTRISFTFRRIVDAKSPRCNCDFVTLCDSQLERNANGLVLGEKEARRLEALHVHEVYDDISKEFSGTRYAQWPRVTAFLRTLPETALVADIGCGNGKNMTTKGRPDLVFVGGDYSFGLLDECRRRNRLEVGVSREFLVPR